MVDTEGTGTKDNNVCQFAYLDFSSGTPEAGNFFFAVDEMSDYAREVHGLSVSSLLRLSKGRRFADDAHQIAGLLTGKYIAGHSVGCDIRALRGEFSRCGVGFSPEKQFCTMAHFTPVMRIHQEGQRKPKNPSLIEVCEYLGVKDEAVLRASCDLYGANTNHHDARFDVCATYLCIKSATERGMLRGLLPEVK